MSTVRYHPTRAGAGFTPDRERFDQLAARLDVPAVLWSLPTTRVGERLPRFPILPWPSGGPYLRREILRPDNAQDGTPRPAIPKL
ncbi:MAG: hypothetical protein ACYDCL_07090 [Myxococcales bacterium]